jgi:hypothetical protein
MRAVKPLSSSAAGPAMTRDADIVSRLLTSTNIRAASRQGRWRRGGETTGDSQRDCTVAVGPDFSRAIERERPH